MRIVVLGYIIRGPYGGLCWDPLQFTLGLKRLGHEVLFLEDSDDFPGYSNPESIIIAKEKGFDFIQNLFTRYDLQNNWAYFDSTLNQWFGLSNQTVFQFCNSADILLNISGVNPLREWLTKIPCRIFLDTDPLFTQVKLLQLPVMLEYAKGHTCHFSIGENIGQPDCKIPTDEFNWKPTKQPVVLDIWEFQQPARQGKWTTIMAWKSYKPASFRGETYGMKDQSFPEYLILPKMLPEEKFELGISSDADTRKLLSAHGWEVVEAITPTETPWSYRDYVSKSKGEWSIAKQGFVSSKTGFLSERSMNYMACGKPAVIQDTAFSKVYPTGEGLLCFSTIEEAVEAIEKVNLDYEFHCKQARKLVEATADHNSVLSKLLNEVS